MRVRVFVSVWVRTNASYWMRELGALHGWWQYECAHPSSKQTHGSNTMDDYCDDDKSLDACRCECIVWYAFAKSIRFTDISHWDIGLAWNSLSLQTDMYLRLENFSNRDILRVYKFLKNGCVCVRLFVPHTLLRMVVFFFWQRYQETLFLYRWLLAHILFSLWLLVVFHSTLYI